MGHGAHLKGQGDLVSRLATPVTHIVTPVIPIIRLLTKSPDSPTRNPKPLKP